VHLSIITNIESYVAFVIGSFDLGNFVIKSIAIVPYSCLASSVGWSSLYSACCAGLFL
jgi:hypothetical protein